MIWWIISWALLGVIPCIALWFKIKDYDFILLMLYILNGIFFGPFAGIEWIRQYLESDE